MKPVRIRLALAALTAAVALGEAHAAPEEAARHWRATQIVGMTVQSVTGESLGQVKDIVIDNKGVATHLVLSYGGTLGVGSKLVAVPWSAAAGMMDGSRLVMSRVRLMAAPTFADNKWPDLARQDWSAAADKYWNGSDTALRSAAGPDVDVDSPHRSRRRPERD